MCGWGGRGGGGGWGVHDTINCEESALLGSTDIFVELIPLSWSMNQQRLLLIVDGLIIRTPAGTRGRGQGEERGKGRREGKGGERKGKSLD